jgi:hypothetical protein
VNLNGFIIKTIVDTARKGRFEFVDYQLPDDTHEYTVSDRHGETLKLHIKTTDLNKALKVFNGPQPEGYIYGKSPRKKKTDDFSKYVSSKSRSMM